MPSDVRTDERLDDVEKHRMRQGPRIGVVVPVWALDPSDPRRVGGVTSIEFDHIVAFCHVARASEKLVGDHLELGDLLDAEHTANNEVAIPPVRADLIFGECRRARRGVRHERIVQIGVESFMTHDLREAPRPLREPLCASLRGAGHPRATAPPATKRARNPRTGPRRLPGSGSVLDGFCASDQVGGSSSQSVTQNTLCLTSAPCEPSAFTTSLTW